MSAAFVIVNYNSASLAAKLAERISAFSSIGLVVIVDNCSTDNSMDCLSNIAGGKIKLIQSPKNGGYSFGNNLGANVCTEYGAEYCFFSNPDIIVNESDLSRILEAFEKTEYTALSGVMCDSSGKVIDKIQKRDRYIDDILTCFSIGRRIYEKKQFKDIDFSRPFISTEMLHGCFLGVRLKEFLSVGGFDENMFMYCEERLLSRRFENAGYTQGIVTGSCFIHNHQPSVKTVSTDITYPFRLMYESNCYYLKNYEKIGKFGLDFLKICQNLALTRMKYKPFMKK